MRERTHRERDMADVVYPRNIQKRRSSTRLKKSPSSPTSPSKSTTPVPQGSISKTKTSSPDTLVSEDSYNISPQIIIQCNRSTLQQRLERENQTDTGGRMGTVLVAPAVYKGMGSVERKRREIDRDRNMAAMTPTSPFSLPEPPISCSADSMGPWNTAHFMQ